MSLKNRLAKVEKELKPSQDNIRDGQCMDHYSDDELLEIIQSKKTGKGYLTKKRRIEFVKSQDSETLRRIIDICKQRKKIS